MFSLKNLKSFCRLNTLNVFPKYKALYNPQFYNFSQHQEPYNLNTRPASELHPDKQPQEFNHERNQLKKEINDMKRDHKLDHERDPLQEPIQERIKHKYEDLAKHKDGHYVTGDTGYSSNPHPSPDKTFHSQQSKQSQSAADQVSGGLNSFARDTMRMGEEFVNSASYFAKTTAEVIRDTADEASKAFGNNNRAREGRREQERPERSERGGKEQREDRQDLGARRDQKEEGIDMLGMAGDVSVKMAEALQESMKVWADVTNYTVKRTAEEAKKMTDPNNFGKTLEKTAEGVAQTVNATVGAFGKLVKGLTEPDYNTGSRTRLRDMAPKDEEYEINIRETRPPTPPSGVVDKDQVEINDSEEWRMILDRNTRPIVLEFYKGDSQGRRMHSKLGVKGDKRGCLFVSANIDKLPDLAQHMKVHDRPTSLLIHNSKIVYKAEEERDLDGLVDKANEILAEQSLYTWY